MKKLSILILIVILSGCYSMKPQGNYIVARKELKNEIFWYDEKSQVDSFLIANGIKVLNLDSIMNSKNPVLDYSTHTKYIYVQRKK